MDAELLRLVEAIRDGAIRDADRALKILRDARAAQQSESDRVYAEHTLIDKAQRALLEGWPAQTFD